MAVNAQEFVDSLAELVAEKVVNRIEHLLEALCPVGPAGPAAPKGQKEKEEKPKPEVKKEKASKKKLVAEAETSHGITYDMMLQAAKNVSKKLNDAEPVKEVIAKFGREPNQTGLNAVFEIDYPKLLEAMDDLIGDE